jgi:hypothetical protein
MSMLLVWCLVGVIVQYLASVLGVLIAEHAARVVTVFERDRAI